MLVLRSNRRVEHVPEMDERGAPLRGGCKQVELVRPVKVAARYELDHRLRVEHAVEPTVQAEHQSLGRRDDQPGDDRDPPPLPQADEQVQQCHRAGRIQILCHLPRHKALLDHSQHRRADGDDDGRIKRESADPEGEENGVQIRENRALHVPRRV